LLGDFIHAHHETVIWIQTNPKDTRIVFNNFLDSHFGQSLSDNVVDVALSNILITADPKPASVFSFAEKADTLGYLGRNGYDLSELFYSFDTNSIPEDDL